MTFKDLKGMHESVLRNKSIANAFYVRGLIKKWGLGTNKMIELCKIDNIPEPDFIERTGGVAVIFKLKDQTKSLEQNRFENELTPRQIAIFMMIKKSKALNIQQILSGLQDPPSPRTVKKDLSLLRELGLIELKRAARNSIWIAKWF